MWLQAVSLVLGDPVAFRFQWPRGSELRIRDCYIHLYVVRSAKLAFSPFLV